MSLGHLLENYSMAQMALISHVAYLKFEDDTERARQERDEPSGRYHGKYPVPEERILNKNDQNNAQAYALIAGGALG